MDTITPVTDYIEGHFRKMSSGLLPDGDTLNMVGGEGGVQVDVVFYMVSNRMFGSLQATTSHLLTYCIRVTAG